MTTLTTSVRTWRGLTLGGFASPYVIERETGLDDLDVRSGIRNLPRSDGAIAGAHYASPRTIVLDLAWYAATAAEAEALTAALRAVTSVEETTLYEYGIVRPDGSEVFVRGRVIRRSLPRNVDTETTGAVRATIAIECPDPRVYAASLSGVVVPVYGSSGGGLNLPIVNLPYNMTAAELSLGVAVVGGGSKAWPLIRFDFPDGESGDADGFALTNLSTGQELEIVTTLLEGQVLFADMDAYVRATGALVVGIGTSSRFGDWTAPREPFYLRPGTNLLRFDLDGDAPIACRVDWRDTDL